MRKVGSEARPEKAHRMRWLTGLRTLIYMSGFVLVWGWVALSLRRYDASFRFALPQGARVVGVVMMAVGGAIALTCGALFSLRGRGTPAPFDPPREFVADGPYRWVRNPMYIGGLTLLVGFGLWERSISMLLLALVLWLAVHAFVVYWEEPGLESRFGASYLEYKNSVNRWLPRRSGGSK
jgi:protein-S-isoprenylcysteine O-methyltransferase Ste14